ncbi:hypothetical protein [Victivallis sp. Marseille-Q1083]|uniref:hypothetical protein n=1 Tax=Victivallis sp. Marseille-Q1083 TaxID=2717288 RepID=UPI00158E7A61|nr:hypothetical protein [Victivallis sp. Marseille-Q1083]
MNIRYKLRCLFLFIIIKIVRFNQRNYSFLKIAFMFLPGDEYNNAIKKLKPVLEALEYNFENSKFFVNEIEKIKKSKIELIIMPDNFIPGHSCKKMGKYLFMEENLFTSWSRIFLILFIHVEKDKNEIDKFIERLETAYKADFQDWKKYFYTFWHYEFT